MTTNKYYFLSGPIPFHGFKAPIIKELNLDKDIYKYKQVVKEKD